MTSIYLLGQQNSSSSLWQPYQHLIDFFSHLGEFLSAHEHAAWLNCYDRDSQHQQTLLPLLVFRPFQTSAIAPFVQACYEAQIPMTARCAGTGFTGGAIASQTGIILLTGHLRQIIQYDPKEGTVLVEPGVTPRQLNACVNLDNWQFTLDLITEGVAGLAGCLSCAAKGYLSQSTLLEHILSVEIVDGTGRVHTVPGALTYGAEGMFGIVIGLQLQLKKQSKKRKVFQVEQDPALFFDQMPFFQNCSILSGLGWEGHSTFTLVFEGEEWRMQSTVQALQKRLMNLIELSPEWQVQLPYSHLKQSWIILSVAVHLRQLKAAVIKIKQLSLSCELNCQLWTNLCEGSIQILLSSEETSYAFTKKCEQFLVLWTNELAEQGGYLVSRHGVGSLLQAYTPPFFNEEELHFLKKIKKGFDPAFLFSRQHFFPIEGKSLERIIGSNEGL